MQDSTKKPKVSFKLLTSKIEDNSTPDEKIEELLMDYQKKVFNRQNKIDERPLELIVGSRPELANMLIEKFSTEPAA